MSLKLWRVQKTLPIIAVTPTSSGQAPDTSVVEEDMGKCSGDLQHKSENTPLQKHQNLLW